MSQLGIWDEPAAPPQAPDLGLRYYQQEAREAVHADHVHVRGTVVECPTGTGKSRLAGALAWDEHLVGGRTLVLTPTITLTRQMYKDMRALGLQCGMEQASNRVERPLPPVVVASVDSMRGKRLEAFAKTDFTHIITDETHRCVSPKYTAIYAHFEKAKLTGLTATPDRADGVSLGNVYDRVAYKMTMLRAIKEGWLVPLRFKTAVTDFDATKLRTIAGDIDAGSVAAEIMRSGLLHEAANTLAELSEGERTVAFLPTVAASQAFVAELEARGVPAIHVDASTPEQHRDEAVSQFVSGAVRVLSNVGIFVEGWDCPAASVVALLNPTKSRSRICQMVGRSTRRCQGKDSSLIIDFCPGRLRKGRLASPADALAGEMLPDLVHQSLEDGDLVEAIAKAEVTAAEIEERERKKRERSERRKQRKRDLALLARQKRYQYDVHEHNAESLLGGGGDSDASRETRSVEVRPATEAQRATLVKMGIKAELAAAMDGPAASRLIGKLIARARAGYASLNQLKAIRQFAKAPDTLPFDVAHKACDYVIGECGFGKRRKVDARHLESILRGS